MLLGRHTIGEVARRIGVSTSAIKLWEKQGYIPKARRATLRQTRIYTEEQVQEIIEFMRGG